MQINKCKLGYGGTKSEMERLLADAQKLSGVKYNISNLNDVYEAIHVVQEELGVTGTTALESAETFSGSLASMQAAASNVLANLTLGEDIQPSLEALGKTVGTFVGGNLIPMVGNIFTGLPHVAIGAITAFDWKTCLTGMLDTGKKIVVSYSDLIFGTDPSVIKSVASGIRSNLPEITDAAGDTIEAMVGYVMADGLPMVFDVGTDVALSLVDGVIDCAPEAAGAALTLCGRFLGAVASNSPKLIESGITAAGKLAAGLIKATPEAVAAAWKITLNIKDKFLSYNWAQLGKDILAGIAKGIYSAVGSIITAVKDAARRALSGAKDALEIRSPSRKFQNEVGAQIPAGIAVGVEKNSDAVKSAMRELSDYAQTSFDTSLSVKGSMSFATSGSAPVEAQSDSVVTLMRDLLDSNLQAYERIIYLLELLLEAILNIDIGGDTITKLITDYQRKVAVVKGG